MEELMLIIYKALKEFGIVNTLFTTIILAALWYIPKLFNKHFEAIDKLHDEFAEELEKIADKHASISDKIIDRFTKQMDVFSDRMKDLQDEHNKQMMAIDKTLNKLDTIHADVTFIKAKLK